MTEQAAEPDPENSEEEEEPQGLDLGDQEGEYIKKSDDPVDYETRD